MRAPSGRQSITNNFDASCVRHGNIKIHVGEARIEGNPRSSFAANSRKSALKRDGARNERPRCSANGTVVSQSISVPLAAASGGRELEGSGVASECGARAALGRGHWEWSHPHVSAGRRCNVQHAGPLQQSAARPPNLVGS